MERRFGSTLVNARSLAGVGSTLAFPEWSLCVDLGVCTSAALRTNVVALTHTHADHMSGIPQYLGVRALFGMKPCRFVVPEAAMSAFRDFVDALGRLQGKPFDCTIEAAIPGTDVPLSDNLWLRPFPVQHNIPAVGYLIVRRVRKLKAEHVNLHGDDIARRKQDNADVLFDLVETPLAAITGDSLAAAMNLDNPLIASAGVLFLESTFVDARRTVEHARLGAHAHLTELIPLLSLVSSEHIVLYHFSQIYRSDEIEAAVQSAIPDILAGRIHLLLPQEEDRL